jgi:hypothetical protein
MIKGQINRQEKREKTLLYKEEKKKNKEKGFGVTMVKITPNNNTGSVSRHSLQESYLVQKSQEPTKSNEEGAAAVVNMYSVKTEPYRPKSVEVKWPYNQKVFDSLNGALQGGISYFNKSNRKKSW